MPVATAADIELGTRAQQVEKVENATIKARYPNAARDDLLDPATGYFDLVVDAQTVLAARAALQGVERSRYAVEVEGIIWFDPIAYAGVRLIDSEATPPLDLLCLVARWQVDCEAERTSFELLG
jgi:hypothetical protein